MKSFGRPFGILRTTHAYPYTAIYICRFNLSVLGAQMSLTVGPEESALLLVSSSIVAHWVAIGGWRKQAASLKTAKQPHKSRFLHSKLTSAAAQLTRQHLVYATLKSFFAVIFCHRSWKCNWPSLRFSSRMTPEFGELIG